MEDDSLQKYRDYKSNEFPAFQSGELHLLHNIVLGKFPVCSSSIQKDFDNILEEGKINNLLNELLLEVNDLDYYSDAFYGEIENKDDDVEFSTHEKDLIYINDLDSSQENVLSAIEHLDKLVIQGPPGTGKSQVISNLIAKFVNDEKTVLMVSEKKTALDVVYSRLGNLSKYALLIDDVGNKELFYRQLENMVFLGKEYKGEAVDIEALAQEIDVKIRYLEKIATQLHQIGKFGIEPYKLYIQNKKIDLQNEEVSCAVRKIHSLLNKEIRDIQYNELTSIHRRLSNIDLLDKLSQFKKIITDYPWIKNVNAGMNELELLELDHEHDEFMKMFEEFQSSNIFVKLFKKFSLKKVANKFMSKYFVSYDKNILDILMKRPMEIREGANQYIAFETTAPLYNELSISEKNYVEVLFQVEDMYASLFAANDAIYNDIIFENIIEFETDNKEILNAIGNYSNIITELADLISEKKKLTHHRLENILAHSMGNITYAKRTGEIRRIIESKRKWSVNRFISKYNFEIFKGVKIWLLTPEVVSEIVPLQAGIFDLVIFDEASQMYVEKGLPSIHRAQKVVIAGDHKQLRPSNLGTGRMDYDDEDVVGDQEDDNASAALEEESLLDLARFKYQDVMLNFHYRSRYEELIAFSNYAFYKGRLYVSPNVDNPEKPPIEYHKMDDAIWANRSNIVEARYVVELLKRILDERTNEETIGIITFNASQRDLIMDLIDDQCALDQEFAAKIRAEMIREKDGEDIGLFIKNIESVQGDERDIIIFSIGYAKNSDGRLIRNFGWLNQKGGENRLNVAVSRAKQKVYVIASFMPDELQVEDTKNDGPKILKKYLQYAYCISRRDTEGAKQILHSFGDDPNPGENISFDSEFEMQVYDKLNERLADKGYKVDTQVGVGGYSIDLAIKKNNQYILAVECDGRTYHSSKSARERDYHRQKYLESRGWRIHRIWSTNWWKNPNMEIDKIENIVLTL